MTLDVDLQPSDILVLNSADAIAAFFARLGYDTNVRIPQSPKTLGITDSTSSDVRHAELLASQDGLLQVYLFELKSVTVAHANAIARAFRNKAGNYLFVLTSDYDRIDVMLAEKALPVSHGTALRKKEVVVRPRILTLARRSPGRRELRVLRRLTYTESDPFAQYDKLLGAYATFDWSEEHFNNRALFADYYLQERLPELSEWRENMAPFFGHLSEIYAEGARTWATLPESEIRERLYEPLFDVLGFRFKRGKAPTSGEHQPDYILHSGDASHPLALCLCYPWGRSLDGADDVRDADTPDENPAAAVVSVLRDAAATWAIVTNGKLWRLYNGRASSVASSYYEVDLEEVLAETVLGMHAPDLSTAIRYYALFFRSSAFAERTEMREGVEITTTFLDILIRDSEEYAKSLGDRLKERIFEEVFPILAEGFIESIRRKEGRRTRLDQATLDTIFQGTLTLLYRLLFLLYAESRDLLPVKEVRGYYEQSLRYLCRKVGKVSGNVESQIAANITKHYAAASTDLYDHLLNLFRIIDQGASSVNVPTYNGGLFLSEPAEDDASADAVNGRFLLTNAVPDRALAHALDLLARDEDQKTNLLVPIDYKSLGVRHLGSIYEGLLEFRLRVAAVPMAIVKGKRTEQIVPYEDAVREKLAIVMTGRGKEKVERMLAKGKAYLENDKRERKATGSYYTPDYIVKYIVENTVGPVLVEKFATLESEMRKAQKRSRNAAARAKAFDKPEEAETFSPADQELVDRLFGVTVLDPAMGSGHFLVEAADFISDRMIDFLNGFPRNPVERMLVRTRTEILERMEELRITIDPARLTDVNLIKRHVLKRCIYGVDLNPMAVELAKVSLWLNCFTLGAPLSFLDHHLKCGNSLVGANIDAVRETLEQDLFGGQFAGLMLATQGMIHVGELSDVTAQQIQESKRTYVDATHVLQPFREVLDLWTSRYFGNQAAKNVFESGSFPAIDKTWKQKIAGQRFMRKRGKHGAVDEYVDGASIIAGGEEAARNQRFFHWELEFPEIFYGKGRKKDNPGFDAVVGNPPYVRQEQLDLLKPYLKSVYAVFAGAADLYIYFYEFGLTHCRRGGSVGFVSSGTFARANFAVPFRNWLPSIANFAHVVDYGENQPFVGVEMVRPSIVILKRHVNGRPSEAKFRTLLIENRIPSSLQDTMAENGIDCDSSVFDAIEWKFQSSALTTLFRRIVNAGTPLVELYPQSMFYGIKTGLNEAFVISPTVREKLVSADPNSKDVIVPVLTGSDLRPWSHIASSHYLILTRRGIDITRYPIILKHLESFRERLEPQPVGWTGKTWPGRKEGNYAWYEIQDSVDYVQEFMRPKIVWPDISKLPRFCWDEDGYFVNNTAYILTGVGLEILCILQSRALWFIISQIATPLRLRAGLWQYRLINQFIERLPIPEIDTSSRLRLVEIAVEVGALARERQTHSATVLSRILADADLTRSKLADRLRHWDTVDVKKLFAELRSGSNIVNFSSTGWADWERFILDQQNRYNEMTNRIIQIEVEMNEIVCRLFGLDISDRVLLEEITKYPYGVL